MVWMIDAKRRHDWQLASTLVWITAEVNRDRKRRRKPFKPDDFNPCVTTRPSPAKASVESLGEALKYAGPVVADANMSLEETLAILGTLGNVGIQGSSLGNALKRLRWQSNHRKPVSVLAFSPVSCPVYSLPTWADEHFIVWFCGYGFIKFTP